MTKKLEELFELPNDVEKDVNQSNLEKANIEISTEDALSNLEKIEQALPQVRGLESSDQEMDELADLAKNSYKDLMDLGMQVDSRFSAEIFNSAGTMLNHAITAKTAKLDKKLKMIDLQLKKARLDQIQPNDPTPHESGTGQVLSRNDLLERILGKNQKTQNE
jgi:hypothetical protein